MAGTNPREHQPPRCRCGRECPTCGPHRSHPRWSHSMQDAGEQLSCLSPEPPIPEMDGRPRPALDTC